MKPSLQRRTYTAREAAALLGISHTAVIDAVDRYIADPTNRTGIAGFRIGANPGARRGRVLIIKADFDRMLGG